MCESVKIAEKALGSSVKACQPEESQMADVSRKSIVMRKSVKAGTLLSSENLTIKRPGNGLPPSFLKNLIGLKLSIDKKSDDLVSLKDIE